jgi:hypothetical protein
MDKPLNPFAAPMKIGNVNIKLNPEEAAQVKALTDAAGMTKAEVWSMILHTALAAFNSDNHTVQMAAAYVASRKADNAKKA